MENEVALMEMLRRIKALEKSIAEHEEVINQHDDKIDDVVEEMGNLKTEHAQLTLSVGGIDKKVGTMAVDLHRAMKGVTTINLGLEYVTKKLEAIHDCVKPREAASATGASDVSQ